MLNDNSIIQDSVSDWQNEASVMDLVYQNGICNLAASHPTDPWLGLFCERDTSIGGAFHALWEWADMPATATVYCDWFTFIEDHAALNKRGWVLQERLLSPRTIHFTLFPYWECRELISCEACPNGIKHLYPTETHYEIPTASAKLSVECLQVSQLVKWPSIIDRYSACDLTKPNDKLSALSGIARTFSRYTKSTYCAGLWSDTLMQDLLWQVQKQRISRVLLPSKRPEQYIGKLTHQYNTGF